MFGREYFRKPEILLSSFSQMHGSYKKIGKKFTIPYIFQTIGNGRHSKFLKRIATWTERSPLKHFGIPINLYDNFFLIARKKPEKA